jgi:hypothetical protein
VILGAKVGAESLLPEIYTLIQRMGDAEVKLSSLFGFFGARVCTTFLLRAESEASPFRHFREMIGARDPLQLFVSPM